MTQTSATVEAAYLAINEGDLDAFLALVAEDVEFTSLVAEAEGATYRGHDGACEWWHTVRSTFSDGRWEVVELTESGSHALARVHISGSIRGVPVEQTMWQALELRGATAVWWGFYRAEREARAALGWPGASPS
jgi:ketosteroid isomerase-like protein